MSGTKSRILAAATIVVLVAVALAVYLVRAPSIKYESNINAVVECTKRSDIVPCARPYVQKLLDYAPASKVLSDLMARKVRSYQCHYVGHIIGQELYYRNKNLETAFPQCTKACNAACEHGLIGEAFRTQSGLNSDDDVAHLDRKELLSAGRRLCTTVATSSDLTIGGACHGVGHALFISYQDMRKSSEACHSIARKDTVDDCLRGIYMEYSDVVNSRSVWQSLYASSTKRSMKEFSQICSQVPQDEVSPCYYNLPTLIYGAYRSSGDTAARKEIVDRVKSICNVAPDSVHRKACIFGYGASLSDELPRSLPAAVRICDAFLTMSDNFACSAGLLSLNIEYGRGREAIGYCMAFASGPIRQGCFRVLFEKVGSYYPSVDGVEKLCPASEVSCRESAELARHGALHEYF